MTTADHTPSPDVVERLLTIVARDGMVAREKLSLDAPLDSLGIDSAEVILILMSIEEEFGVYIPVDTEMSEIKTVGDLVNALAAHIAR
jgi:acyl carrier protein